jgi:hypothetical protein
MTIGFKASLGGRGSSKSEIHIEYRILHTARLLGISPEDPKQAENLETLRKFLTTPGKVWSLEELRQYFAIGET